MYSVFDDINGYSEPKCWPRFNLGNPNPAPVFCPPEDFFTYYDCCSLDYGDCCRYPKWGNIIIFSKTKRQDNKPPPTVEHVEKEVECGGTEISLSPEDKYYHRNTRNTYI
uniref:Vesicular, overexpressed in cancer, prosurvival protein 1 n=1 Tax=Strongyloides stercoralis TaxID=6248 RepID=A0AAF5I1T2_STRER